MNEHEGNSIELRLVNVLSRPNGKTDEGKQSMQEDSQKHGEGPQGVQIVVSFNGHHTLSYNPKAYSVTSKRATGKKAKKTTKKRVAKKKRVKRR